MIASAWVGARPRGRSALDRLVIVCLVGMIATLTGCSAPFVEARPSPTPHVVDCVALAKKGVKPCPPDSPSLQHPRVVDRTGGKVPEATMERWGWALLRTFAYSDWAIAHNADALLRTGILSSQTAIDTSFSDGLKLIERAKDARGTIRQSGPTVVEIALVPLPDDVQAHIQSNGLRSSPFGWVVRIQGPQRTDLVAGNTSTSLGSVPSDARGNILDWGKEVERTPVGPVWTYEGTSDCQSDAAVQRLCET